MKSDTTNVVATLPEEATKNIIEAGMLKVSSANDLIQAAATTAMPKDLFKGLWMEGEVACLFADSNVGKSILAVQIAKEIANSQPVVYLDCELSDKQFQQRYSSPEGDILHKFPEQLFIAKVAPEKIGDGDFERTLLINIEQAAIKCQSKVIIIDNITYVCNTSEKGDVAGAFMMKLKALQMQHDWSILVIAHTPKRMINFPLTMNDLAGSKKLFNFFDTVFAIGRSAVAENLRYLKQLKVRSGEFLYTDSHVLVMKLVKGEDQFLSFAEIGYDSEQRQLHAEDLARINLEDDIAQKHKGGVSFREIAKQTGIPSTTVHNYWKNYLKRQKEGAILIEEMEEDMPEGLFA